MKNAAVEIATRFQVQFNSIQFYYSHFINYLHYI